MRRATANPVKPIAKIAAKEYKTNTHLMLANMITSKKMLKNIITLVPLVI